MGAHVATIRDAHAARPDTAPGELVDAFHDVTPAGTGRADILDLSVPPPTSGPERAWRVPR